MSFDSLLQEIKDKDKQIDIISYISRLTSKVF